MGWAGQEKVRLGLSGRCVGSCLGREVNGFGRHLVFILYQIWQGQHAS